MAGVLWASSGIVHDGGGPWEEHHVHEGSSNTTHFQSGCLRISGGGSFVSCFACAFVHRFAGKSSLISLVGGTGSTGRFRRSRSELLLCSFHHRFRGGVRMEFQHVVLVPLLFVELAFQVRIFCTCCCTDPQVEDIPPNFSMAPMRGRCHGFCPSQASHKCFAREAWGVAVEFPSHFLRQSHCPGSEIGNRMCRNQMARI